MENKVKSILTEVAKITKDFLLKNGGMDNGFQTFAQGSIAFNSFGTLEVRLNNDKLSLHDLNILAAKLEHKLHQYLKQENFKGTICMDSIHLTHGCYITQIVYKEIVTI